MGNRYCHYVAGHGSSDRMACSLALLVQLAAAYWLSKDIRNIECRTTIYLSLKSK